MAIYLVAEHSSTCSSQSNNSSTDSLLPPDCAGPMRIVSSLLSCDDNCVLVIISDVGVSF